MASLLENYKNRLSIAESVYSKSHNGAPLDNARKILTAQCLRNVDKYMTEAFQNSVGTQRADMGQYKRFCMNLTNVAVPNLIAPELVLTKPMTSMTGYIAYIKYTAGSTKGNTTRGKVFNDPFRLGDVDVDYTSARVTETAKVEDVNGDLTIKLMWFPVYNGTDAASKVRFTDPGVTVDEAKSDFSKGVIVVTGTTAGTELKVGYVYDNTYIPANDLPILNAEMDGMSLTAKARRIAIFYSQLADYQAKTDYDFNLGDQLSQKAVAQLQYEVDTEVTQLLIDNAAEDAELTWSKTLPVGVSKREHYEGFAETIEIGKQKIYDRTRRFAPNYILVASNILPILSFINDFTAAPTSSVNGPYFAGTLHGIRVFVTPNIAPGKFVLGVNGDDLMSSAAVFAPYMAVIPTQLLGMADGSMSQGFSTMYDLKILNKDLLVAGKIVD